MQKKTYQCLEPIRHNGQRYMPPATIELTDEEANRLIDCDAVVEIDSPETLKPKEPLMPADTLNPPAGTPNGESTASADALAEQTDKDTNQDPLNNKDGGDATLAAQTHAAASTNIEEANGPAIAEGDASATPEAPEAAAPGAEGNLTPASADADQDPVDPAPAVDSTAGGEGQTILDPAATPLDGAATGEPASPVAAEAPAPADPAPADPAPADPAPADPAPADPAPADPAPADPAPADPAPAAPASKKTRKATAAK